MELIYDVRQDYVLTLVCLGVLLFIAFWLGSVAFMVLWPNRFLRFAESLGFSPPPPGLRRNLLFIAHRAIGVFVLAIGGPFCIWIGFMVITYYFELQSAVAEGRCRSVEGVVERFVAEDIARGTLESFSVSGVRFSYQAKVLGGFHRTRAQGGPMTGGVYARICYIERSGQPEILRLEIEPTP